MLEPRHYPDFIICPNRGFVIEKLWEHGYKDSYYFLMGSTWGFSKRRWTGNKVVIQIRLQLGEQGEHETILMDQQAI